MKTTIKYAPQAVFAALSIALFLGVCCGSSVAQVSLVPSSDSKADSTPTPVATPVATPIPLSEISIQSEETKKKIDSITEDLGKKFSSINNIENQLPKFKQEIDRNASETSSLLRARPSLETIRVTEQQWEVFSKEPPAWKKDLQARLSTLDEESKELGNLKELWEMTRDALEPRAPATGEASKSDSGSLAMVPKEISQTIASTLALIEQTRKLVEQRRSQLLKLQAQVGKQEDRISEELSSFAEYREEALTNLFVRDSPPIWNVRRQTDSVADIFAEAGASFSGQYGDLRDYVYRNTDRFIFHILMFLLFSGVLFWARKKMRPLVAREPDLKPAFSAFELPTVGALILALMLSGWFYPQPPRMLSSIIGAALLIPGITYLRRILEKPLFPILNALVVFYSIDLVRQITATIPLLTRLIFVFEMLGAVVFLIWYLRSIKGITENATTGNQGIFVLIRKVALLLLFLFALALAANVFGYVSFSNVVGNSVLSSSYVGLILYTAVQIVKSLFVFAFRVRPLSSLGMVINHSEFIKEKVFWLLKWSGIVIWALMSLDFFSIRQSVVGFLGEWLTAELVVGSITISLSDVLIFGFTIWVSFALSKFIRFALNEDIYPRVDVAGGVSYAISTVLHYVILVVGFVIAVAALGIDMTKFTILAGALGVGLGFGLQNIVNNFVSGLILLFERPVKVSDVIEINGKQGDLMRIGLRASVLRTLDGSELIVPNGQLISEQVTNWTFSDQQRRIEVDVGVAYGTDPNLVIDLLTSVVENNDDVIDDPPARTIFVGFGESSLDFQLRAWTMKADKWMLVKSELLLAIHAILSKNDIEIPFPQRDLHLRSVDADAAGGLSGKALKVQDSDRK